MRHFLRNQTLHLILTLLAGLGLGLAYSWLISPVKYIDANPAILRADFKDQYRIVIAGSYAATHDLARARARLALLGDADPTGELSAQAQRMLASGESFEIVSPLAQLATDLQQGVASIPITSTSFASIPFTAVTKTPPLKTPDTAEPIATETQSIIEQNTSIPTTSFGQTALVPVAASPFAPRPTFTQIPPPGAPFTFVSQDKVCEPGSQPGLLQFILMDARRKQIAGIEIIITSAQDEDHSFTGFKPELGNGYADFVMKADTTYSVRVFEGGTFVPNISAPICKDPNGTDYLGGLLLTFQQP